MPPPTPQPTGLLLVPLDTVCAVGCIVTGPGIQPGTTITGVTPITFTSPGYLEVTLSIIPWSGNTVPPGVVNNGFNNTSLLTQLTESYTSDIVFTCNQSAQYSVSSINEISGETLSFKEDSKGWVSFKSFIQENGISLNNAYYTFNSGNMYAHNVNEVRNEFYGNQFDSSVDVIFNKAPGSIKSFSTLNYEGSQSRVTPEINNNPDYYDNFTKEGWYAESMISNSQELGEMEFWDKEDKWFGQIKGVKTEWLSDGTAGNIDPREFSYQGIGNADVECEPCVPGPTLNGCPEFQCINGECVALPDCGSGMTLTQCRDMCFAPSWDCVGNTCVERFDGSGQYPTLPDCQNYCFTPSWDCTQGASVLVTTGPLTGQTIAPYTCYDPGTSLGAHATLFDCQSVCTTPATWDCVGGACVDFGAGTGLYTAFADCSAVCIAIVPGCTNPLACNYDPAATIENFTCLTDYGCTDATATNYDPTATCDDGSCIYAVSGCTDATACNYVALATVDDGSCTYPGCTINTFCNYNPNAGCNDGSCFGSLGCIDPTAINFDPGATCDDGSCIGCLAYGCTDITACNYDPLIELVCDDGSCGVLGCTDPYADNFNGNAACDDGSCTYLLLYVPDVQFKNYLENPPSGPPLDYAIGFDKSFSLPEWAFGYKVYHTASQFSGGTYNPGYPDYALGRLNLTGRGVTDFTGLQGMYFMFEFTCEGCGLTDADISSTITQLWRFPWLGQLRIKDNLLTTLDLSNPQHANNPDLTQVVGGSASNYKHIDVRNNSITSINLTHPHHPCAPGACGSNSSERGFGTLDATGNPALVIKVSQDDLDIFNADPTIAGSGGTIIGKVTRATHVDFGTMAGYWLTPPGSTVVGCPPLTLVTNSTTLC